LSTDKPNQWPVARSLRELFSYFLKLRAQYIHLTWAGRWTGNWAGYSIGLNKIATQRDV